MELGIFLIKNTFSTSSYLPQTLNFTLLSSMIRHGSSLICIKSEKPGSGLIFAEQAA